MSFLNIESLDDEIKELLDNYKSKKATIHEPCTLKNFKECLIGLSEELNFTNISYVFNPHVDIENNTLTPEALVKLINSIWILLQHFKNVSEKVENLEVQNHTLESINKQLNHTIGRLKEKLNNEKNEAKACVASAQRVSDQSNDVYQQLLDSKKKLAQLTKQKETNEKCLRTQIARLKLENEKLYDRLEKKSDKFSRCDIGGSELTQLEDRERKQRTIIAQLQVNNQELLREVVALKEEIILEGINKII
ncbi:uncharacterized protein LOC123664336 [Melitaea cinxia]|uniref:uncharacterized protein LOC123664336 n=1 Tax=Melitaea cinxia TaxID=113334 RepID=UPI001E272CCB|nr:uncharacterized protein LOC123664336 [Melitaea cinxia]